MSKLKKFPYNPYIIVCLLFALAVPLGKLGIVPSSVLLTLGSIIYYSVAGVGINLLLGYSGLITLGAAGFMGLAAYLSAYCTEDLGLPFIVSLIISIGIPVLLSLVIGLISLRLEGYYLAIATLGIGEILKLVFIEFEPLTSGFSGKRAQYVHLFGMDLGREGTYLFFCVILLIVLVLVHNLVNSASGRALLALRGSESAAQAMGISVLKYRVTAFALSTAFTAMAGVMYVHFVKYSYPTIWGLGLSLTFLSIVVIGGMRTVLGSVVGALFVIGVPELILKRLPVIGNMSGVPYVFNGVAIILVMMFYSNGLIHLGTDIKRWIMKISKKGAEDN